MAESPAEPFRTSRLEFPDNDVVRALADIADGPAEFILVARERLTDGVGLEVAPISPDRPR